MKYARAIPKLCVILGGRYYGFDLPVYSVYYGFDLPVIQCMLYSVYYGFDLPVIRVLYTVKRYIASLVIYVCETHLTNGTT